MVLFSEIEAAFDVQFKEFQSSRKIHQIVSTAKYEEMLEIILRSSTGNEVCKRTREEENIVRRFEIRYEQGVMILYKMSDGEKNQPKKVVKTEELFELLKY